MQQAWLDVPPRRRPGLPWRDLGIGVAMGVGLCAVAMAIVAGMELAPPPAAEEPLTVSIGVLAKSGEPGAGSGGSGGSGKPGKRRERKASPHPPAGEPAQPRHPSSGASSLPPQPLSVPSPWDAPGGLPGLGDLGEPVEGSTDGDGGTGGGGSGDGGTADGGTGDGGLGAYRSQLASWLAAHFHVEGSGLDAKALRQLRVRAVLELSEDRVVTDARFQPTGTPAVDEAARRALEAVKGQPLPAPPPSLGTLQRRINVVLTCRPDTCD